MLQANSEPNISISCAGFLQVLFLAGAIQLPVFQHYRHKFLEHGSPFENPVFPCYCQLDAIPELSNGIHIMWVEMEDPEVHLLNHIIPLIPQGGEHTFPCLIF